MIIRPATDADVPAITSIYNALISSTAIEWREMPHTVEDMRDWVDGHEVVLVAETAGEVVGLAAYGWFRDAVVRPGYRFTVENTVHVRAEHWGSGLGRRLMEELIERARASGKHVMVAAVDGENHGSVRFHERLGFVEVARMPQVGEKFGRWLDLVLLQLTLDDRPDPPRYVAAHPVESPVAVFFDDFVRDFTAFDGALIAERYATPYVAVHGDGSIEAFDTSAAIAGYFQTILEAYRDDGVVRCAYDGLESVAVGRASWFASVTWQMFDAADVVRSSWRESYNLVQVGPRLLVFSSTDHA